MSADNPTPASRVAPGQVASSLVPGLAVSPVLPVLSECSEPTLSTGPFAGRVAFAQLVRDALATAAREGWHELVLCDATFEDWPLRERAVAESLHAWAKSGRKLTVLATTYEGVLRNQPRFVEWRKTWSHIVECRRCRAADALDFPSAIWSPAWVMQRLDLARSTGFCGPEPGRRVRLRELLDEKIRGSLPGFAATTLGL